MTEGLRGLLPRSLGIKRASPLSGSPFLWLYQRGLGGRVPTMISVTITAVKITPPMPIP
jgi:hypothetical protein